MLDDSPCLLHEQSTQRVAAGADLGLLLRSGHAHAAERLLLPLVVHRVHRLAVLTAAPHNPEVIRAILMPRERNAPQSEVVRAIVLEGSPRCGSTLCGAHRVNIMFFETA